MVGRRTAKDTAKLIDEVARGDRLIEDIKDPQLRETVRLALRLHKDPYSGPDAKTRSRIRSRVLFGLHPRNASLIDRLAIAFELLGRPTPYAMRALGIGLAIVAIGASTALVSAGTVADDALYSVKITSEQMRLSLATSPEDRAVVELSIAEHRLAEATALATLGDEDNAIVATSEYGEHMANAAAELAQVESLQPETATLVVQLQQRIDEHRATAAAVVAQLAEDPSRASAAAALSAVAGRGASTTGLSPAAAIAQEAADTADEAASVAERMAIPARPTGAPSSPSGADRNGTSETGTASARGGEAASSDNPRGKNEKVSKRERAAEYARKAADEAKAAAKKAKEGSRRTPTPTPRHR
ncbi:MAG TPA: DUF5667 domain-containing protein [Methylomirabilota bacterium]|jgi:Domain of unknown function (DUF5667)|nr:DUF5667 domain-containing protein [Methylomirabilota bacterium]